MNRPENPAFLEQQLITYIGNKRALLDFIEAGIETVQNRLGREKLSCLDIFSGSGIVSRFLKRFSSLLICNDMERYSSIINSCYLSNSGDIDHVALRDAHEGLIKRLSSEPLRAGFISELYAPRDISGIRSGERVFYTPRNAMYLDSARQYIDELPEPMRPYFIAPLLSEASIHANTAGVFKGFYKDRQTGTGCFGGTHGDAHSRILGNINIPFPVFSDHDCEVEVRCEEANCLAPSLREVDVAYLDPPYNQHPYGSNYFMLNLIAEYEEPTGISQVSGIPRAWNRSDYNRKNTATAHLESLCTGIKARFLLISFNSEGYISTGKMREFLEKIGRVTVLEKKYNAFRGSRNLHARSKHVQEYLYIVEKS